MSFLLSGSKQHQKLQRFELRLDNPFIVFRGPETDTPATECTGSLVVMTSEPLQFKGVKIVLEGKRRTQHVQSKSEAASSTGPALLTTRATILELTHHVRDERGRPLKHLDPGNHEFRFSFPLAGNTPESIEGLNGSYIVYDLKAIGERGFTTKDLTAKKHLRIVRTLGPDAMESAVASAVYGIWPDKLKYHFEPASKNWIFGTQIQTDIELTPLLAKLGIERIKFTLKETRKIKTEPGPEYSATLHKWVGMWKEEQDVFTDTMTLPQDCEDTDLDTQLPMYKFKATWKLPKSLAVCRQTVEDGDWIQIKHAAHYDILLRNPDGHLSELKAHHPARLFISPNLPVDENNTVQPTETEAATGELDELDNSAPPTYGTHQLDQLVPLYEGIDPSGFFTPGLRSGSATPFGEMASRNASHSNLNQLLMSSTDGGSPDARTLRNRLKQVKHRQRGDHHHQNGDENGDETNHSPTDGEAQRQGSHSSYFDNSSITPTNGMIRDRHHANIAGSPPDHEDYIGTSDYNMQELARMPSYNTAIRSNPRALHADGPPTYHAAISRPPSPSPQAPVLAPLTQAHLRTSGHATPRRRPS